MPISNTVASKTTLNSEAGEVKSVHAMWKATAATFMKRRITGYLAAMGGVVAVALVLWPFFPDVRVLTAANSLLIVVVLVALTWGMAPAVLSSILSALYLNFFYVPPVMKFDFHVDGTDDLIGLAGFLFASTLVGRLSSEAQHRASEIQVLYDQLRAAFDRASHLEGIEQSEQFKSALLDTVTHDLRTPLTSIKAAATTLKSLQNRGSKEVEVTAQNMLNIIVQQSDRLDHFIESMIELARIETGGEPEDRLPEAVPIDEVITAALARAEDVLRQHQIRVECEEDLNVTGSPKAIAQVLFSLLENAAKYAPTGSTIQIIATQDGIKNIRIAVEDEGPGVAAPLREKIFDKFFRDATAPGNPQAMGLGLGLAIARGIVEAQGGRIWVEDRDSISQGARFVIRLPAKINQEALR